MNELSLAFTVGVIASLFSIFVSIVLSAFWKKNILPWYEERLYQGAEISGEWTTLIKYSAEIENEVIYVVKRTGYNIHGYAYCINGSDKGMNWVLDGSFYDLILTISYYSKNKKTLDRGSASLMLVDNGTKLKGHLVYYENSSHSMRSTVLELSPIK